MTAKMRMPIYLHYFHMDHKISVCIYIISEQLISNMYSRRFAFIAYFLPSEEEEPIGIGDPQHCFFASLYVSKYGLVGQVGFPPIIIGGPQLSTGFFDPSEEFFAKTV